MPEPDVRRATEADAHEIAPLLDAYRVFYGQGSDIAGAEAFVRARLANGESVVFLACIRGHPAGFCQLYPVFSTVAMTPRWVLNDLFVDPGARRQGVARALLRAANEHAGLTRADKLELLTERTNDKARSLYESDGWTLDSVYVRYTRAGAGTI